ncbi:MAG: hypothetical protein HY815_00895 [Candidatus Riflebacteria bacterium]|nr:hypothetical protein [Candidatus Riflebacteria bacterium]
MDLMALGQRLQEFFQKSGIKHDLLGKIDEHGAAFFFDLTRPLTCGFLSCEDNAEDLRFSTVSLAISVGETATRSNEDLLALFALNGNFFDASLTVSHMPSGVMHLFVARKFKASDYRIADFAHHVSDLLRQYDLFTAKSS